MFPRTTGWLRAYALSHVALGCIFLTLGLLNLWGTYEQSSNATRLTGTVKSVQPPASSTDSVHLLVQTSGRGSFRVGTLSEVSSDFSPGERAAILIKRGQEPVLDDTRYTGSLVAAGAGAVPLLTGIILWRSRARVVRKPT
jgi:hypothetical protein